MFGTVYNFQYPPIRRRGYLECGRVHCVPKVGGRKSRPLWSSRPERVYGRGGGWVVGLKTDDPGRDRTKEGKVKVRGGRKTGQVSVEVPGLPVEVSRTTVKGVDETGKWVQPR